MISSNSTIKLNRAVKPVNREDPVHTQLQMTIINLSWTEPQQQATPLTSSYRGCLSMMLFDESINLFNMDTDPPLLPDGGDWMSVTVRGFFTSTHRFSVQINLTLNSRSHISCEDILADISVHLFRIFEHVWIFYNRLNSKFGTLDVDCRETNCSAKMYHIPSGYRIMRSAQFTNSPKMAK